MTSTTGYPMYVLGMVLAFVAVVRLAFGSFHLLWFGPSFLLAASLFTAGSSAAYLLWLATRGRHLLRQPAVSDRARLIVVGYAILVLLVLPLVEVISYRLLV